VTGENFIDPIVYNAPKCTKIIETIELNCSSPLHRGAFLLCVLPLRENTQYGPAGQRNNWNCQKTKPKIKWTEHQAFTLWEAIFGLADEKETDLYPWKFCLLCLSLPYTRSFINVVLGNGIENAGLSSSYHRERINFYCTSVRRANSICFSSQTLLYAHIPFFGLQLNIGTHVGIKQ